MKYYHFSDILVVCVFVLSLLCAGCGGSGGAGISFRELADTGNSREDSGRYTGAYRMLEGTLKAQPQYSYDPGSYIGQEGMHLVPLDDRLMPEPGRREQLRMERLELGSAEDLRAYSLIADETENLKSHFRFDPARWEIDGVVSKNPWGTEKFVAIAVEEAPGVLAINNLPVGQASGASRAGGEFAQVFLRPAGSRSASNFTTDTTVGVIWSSYNNGFFPVIDGYGTVDYRLDGLIGDVSSKDGEISSGELTASSVDLLLHPTIHDSIGSSYTEGDEFVSPTFTFHENLIGDYDNNGVVNINDITQIAQFMHGDEEDFTYTARRGVHDAAHPEEWLNLKESIDDFQGAGENDINVFWYLDQVGWTDPTSYEYNADNVENLPSTQVADAIDGNWDGFVLDWPNYDPDGAGPKGYEEYYDTPTMKRPGDVGPIYNHFNERITGYQVYTIPQNSSNYSYSSGTPAIPTNPDSPYYDTICAANWDRDGIDPAPLTPEPKPYTKRFHTTPNNSEGKRYWKDEIETTFSASSFWDTEPSSDTTYDFLIYPYYYDGSQIYRGPASRVIGAFSYKADTFGPQYNTGLSQPDNDSSGNGLLMIGQSDEYCLQFVYDNADDVVPEGAANKWANNNETKNVRYQLYGSLTEANVFSNELTGKSWVEGEDKEESLTRRSMLVTFTPSEISTFGLDFSVSQTAYFGIRAFEESGSELEEYEPGGSGNYVANTTTVEWTFLDETGWDYGPQYRDGSNPPPGNSTGRGINTISVTEQSASNVSLNVNYDLADDVYWNTSIPGLDWLSDNVSYRLYASRTDTGSALFTNANWIYAGRQHWDQGDGVAGAQSGTMDFSFNLDMDDPIWADINSTGNTINFGIWAFETSGAPYAREYQCVTTPNTTSTTLTVEDTIPPVFVEPISDNITVVPQLSDFYRLSWSYDGEVAMYFYPALDGPDYDVSDDITYRCYWSLEYFDGKGDDPSLIPGVKEAVSGPLTFSYEDKYDPDTQFPAFDYNTLVFVLDDNGSDLEEGEKIYFIVKAEDGEGNVSTNFTVHEDAAREIDNTEALVLATGLSSDLKMVGDIQADGDDVYVVYPSEIQTGNRVDVEYRKFHGGESSPSDIDTDILSGATYEPLSASGRNYKLSLTHQVESDGSPLLDNNDDRMPVVAYNAADEGMNYFHLEMMTSARNSSGSWSGTHLFHDQSLSGTIAHTGGAVMYPFTYDNGSGLESKYLLSWLYNPSFTPTVDSKLRQQVSTSVTTWPSFTEPNSNAWPYEFYASQIARSSYNQVINDDTIVHSGLSTAPERTLYLAVGTNAWAYVSGGEVVFELPPLLEIWKTSDLDSWEQNIVSQDLPLLNTDARIITNGFEVVVDPYNGQHFLYVTYYNNDGHDRTPDSNGLRIACAVDNGSGPISTWSSPSSVGLIDGTALNQDQSYDVVDLRVKPGYVSGTNKFDALGCAYVHQDGFLYCAETIGNGETATWGYQTVGGLRELDEGRVLWVKLAYFDDGEETNPYLLYAVQDGFLTGYDIKLWRPGGF